MIPAMTKGRTPPPSDATPPVITPEEGIIRLQELIERGNALLRRAPTDAEMKAYRATLKTALVEAFGSDAALTRDTIRAGAVSDFLNNPWGDHYDPVTDWHKELRAKNTLLADCIAQLKLMEARRKPAATASAAPTAFPTVEGILRRFHKVVVQLRNRRDVRPPLKMEDEYDVQYLLHALLLVSFDDVRPEDTAPSHAGARPRVDFLLKDERIVIEVKKTRPSLADKEIGDELLADIGRYKAHPDCKTLVCFVYDPEAHIRNAAAIIRDLEEHSSADLKVRVLIVPQH